MHHPNDENKAVIRIRNFINDFSKFSRKDFSIKLDKLVKKELLHAGVNTHVILRGYATIVDYLAAFDPSLVLVHKICRIIRDYVKQRPDTMRTIITFITAERPSTAEEFNSSNNKLLLMMEEEQLQDVNDEYVIMVDDNNECRWTNWIPDPYDANPKESRLYRESADVFNMLVSIYGSKDLFVKEYQQLLSERLIINAWTKQLHSEFLYLETMQKRFSEGEFNHCEVMLRDIRESGKVAKYSASELPYPVSAKIISSIYWPDVSSRENNLPFIPVFRDGIIAYEKIYSKHKAARAIQWFTDFGGSVEMDIILGGQNFEIKAPLIQAQILILFTSKEKYGCAELMQLTGLDALGLKRRIDWWCNKGLLTAGPPDEITLEDTYCLPKMIDRIEKLIKQQTEHYPTIIGDELSDDDGDDQIPIEDMVEDLEQYWNYTKNLLKFHSSNDSLTPQKLLRLYKNFSSPGKPQPTIEAVQMFMQKKIKDNQVVFEAGAYKATKDLK